MDMGKQKEIQLISCDVNLIIVWSVGTNKPQYYVKFSSAAYVKVKLHDKGMVTVKMHQPDH